MNARLLVLAAGTFAIGTDGFMIAGILPDLARDLGVGLSEAGLLVTVFSAVYAASSPIIAAFSGKFDRRTLLVAAMGVFAAANLAAAVSSGYAALMIARVAAALSAAMYTPSASSSAAALAGEGQRGRALAVVTGGLTVAIVIGVPIGSFLNQALNWRLSFALVGLIAAAAAAVVAVRFPSLALPAAGSLADRLLVLARPRVSSALLLTAAWTVGGFTMYTYIDGVVGQAAPALRDWIPILLLMFGLGSVLGNWLGGKLADQWGPARTIAVGLIVLLAAFGSLSLLVQLKGGSAASAPLVVLCLMVWGIAGWLLTPPQQVRLLGMAPEAPAVILSWNGTAIYAGVALGSGIGGWALESWGVASLGWVAGAFLLAALGLLAAQRLPAARKWRAAGQA